MTKYYNVNDDTEWDEQDIREYYSNMQKQGLYLDLTFEEFIEELILNGDFKKTID